MTTFTIDAENSITAVTPEEVAAGLPDGQVRFTSEKELARLASDWPTERLVAISNSIPGGKRVTKLASRKAAVARIWKGIQSLAGSPKTKEPAPTAPTSKAAKATKAKATPRPRPSLRRARLPRPPRRPLPRGRAVRRPRWSR